jgi:chemotaxis methyl-accepting protein methylase
MSSGHTTGQTPVRVEPILEKLLDKRGINFIDYRRSTIQRRVERRLSATKCSCETEYLELLDADEEEYDKLLRELTIKFSEFYRDPPLWELLEIAVLPRLIDARLSEGKKHLKVWSAGCAFGEEAFTAAMVIDRTLKNHPRGHEMSYSITGTDIDRSALAKAMSGEYTASVLTKLPGNYLEDYLSHQGKTYVVQERLRELVSFRYDNLLEELPQDDSLKEFDLVFCRNVLIYLTRPLQTAAFNRLMGSAYGGSILVLGTAELPPLHWRKLTQEINHELRVLKVLDI